MFIILSNNVFKPNILYWICLRIWSTTSVLLMLLSTFTWKEFGSSSSSGSMMLANTCNTVETRWREQRTDVHPVSRGRVPGVPGQDSLPPLLHGHGQVHDDQLVPQDLPTDVP